MSIINKIIFLLCTTVLLTIQVNANNPTPCFQLINIECEEDCHHFQSGKMSLGYILKLTVNGQKIEDYMQISDPQNPEKKLDVVALIRDMQWNGQPKNPLGISGKLSPSVRASLLEALCSSNEAPKIEIEWVIYSYDFNERKYFRNFHTGEQPIILTLLVNSFNTNSGYDRDHVSPFKFLFYGDFTPPVGYEDQNLYVAFKSDGKTFSFPIKSCELE